MPRPPRKYNIRVRSVEEDEALYGPDRLPYQEALEAEWMRIHGIAPMPRAGRKIDTEIPAKQVSPRRRRRYDRPLSTKPISQRNTQEGTMPRKAAAPVEETQEAGVDLAGYLDKDVSVAAEAFCRWAKENVGYECDLKTAHLIFTLRRKFQGDPEHDEIVQEIRDERAAAKPTRTAAASEDEGEEEVEEAPAPKRRTRSAATKTTSTSATSKDGTTATTRSTRGRSTTAGAPARRGRKPATAGAAKSGEAPF